MTKFKTDTKPEHETDIVIDAHTALQQRIASSPDNSVWVSANAGSGKTYVLSQRIVRLLLAGTDPARILALTFTKAAAGEMANRVFETLGKWAIMPERELRLEIERIEGQTPNVTQLDRARTLFARALETPGGLKIQTIHAFCEALLHQFPLEANIPGNFAVMDDATQAETLEQAQTAIVLEADNEPASDVGEAFANVMASAGDSQLEKVFAEIIDLRDDLYIWLQRSQGAKAAESAARAHFGFKETETLESAEQKIVDQSLINKLDLGLLTDVCAGIDEAGARKITNIIRDFQTADSAIDKIKAISSLVLTGTGAPRSFQKYPSQKIVAGYPIVKDIFEAEAGRLIEALGNLNNLRLILHTTPLLLLARAIITKYRRIKRDQGLLDFDDLVARTADLLTRSDARRWVLYKLDLGIDHILVDEAQDTSPKQWMVISSLVEEFFAGESARTVRRTVFAVGDEKQSIYSFQGARPESFSQYKKLYKSLADDVGQDMKDVSLSLSFRSTQDVLSAVDTVFRKPENADGLTFEGELQAHTAARKSAPGKVDVWPLVEADLAEAPENVAEPQPQMHNGHQAIKLANRIADEIEQSIRIEGIDPGSILVLVRARDRFMVALNRALKDRNIAVAGADRLALTDHIAVKDLLALGQIMLTPEDDLSLAAVLKSPLFEISEDELYRLARFRVDYEFKITLFDALEKLQTDVSFSAAYQSLQKWRRQVDQMPVYEFYARLLGADGGRQKFYTRLGAEAQDVIDAFLDLTLSHELQGLPGLQAFLEALLTDAPEVKREMDQATGQVRIMTVHAAKGLEAPIVYLVDKCSAAFQGGHARALYKWGDDQNFGYLWVPKSNMHGSATLPLKELEKAQSEQEYRRLLYVAMTRARDHLIVCGYKGKNNPPQPNWHTMVSSTLGDMGKPVHSKKNDFEFLRWQMTSQTEGPNPSVRQEGVYNKISQVEDELPGWVRMKLEKEMALPRPLSPSGAHALIEESLVDERVIPSLLVREPTEEDASPRKRGTAIHVLLQLLPDDTSEDRWLNAESYLKRTLPEFNDAARQTMIQGIRTVLSDPTLRQYFNPKTSRPEVPLMGKIDLNSGPRSVSGTVDRMAVLPDHVMLIDYKTSAFVPQNLDQVNDTYVTQMALYRALVSKLYPDLPIKAGLVWTHAQGGARFMGIAEDKMDRALTKIAQL